MYSFVLLNGFSELAALDTSTMFVILFARDSLVNLSVDLVLSSFYIRFNNFSALLPMLLSFAVDGICANLAIGIFYGFHTGFRDLEYKSLAFGS